MIEKIQLLILIAGFSANSFGQNVIQEKYKNVRSDTIKEYYSDKTTSKIMIVKENGIVILYSTPQTTTKKVFISKL